MLTQYERVGREKPIYYIHYFYPELRSGSFIGHLLDILPPRCPSLPLCLLSEVVKHGQIRQEPPQPQAGPAPNPGIQVLVTGRRDGHLEPLEHVPVADVMIAVAAIATGRILSVSL